MHGVIKCIDGQMVDVVERISLKLVWVSTQQPKRRPFSLRNQESATTPHHQPGSLLGVQPAELRCRTDKPAKFVKNSAGWVWGVLSA